MIKVAGYCRVSTDQKDQANSFASQCRYFEEFVDRQPQWELARIYADEGITGTSTRKRVQFNQMMDDAIAGKFQLILTKEISRFSRNILDTIRYTRMLKELGIGVYFLTDGIDSLESDAELRLSIMGSIAQEESRRTSQRVKWGQTRQMERGVVFGRSLLGYTVHNGSMTINPAEAEIVRSIFQSYADGNSTTKIAKELEEIGCVTPSGSEKWHRSYILKVLNNEKYVGDLVQKKTITPDYLTHRKVRNRGQEEFVQIENHHGAIIPRELWAQVQERLRKNDRHMHSADDQAGEFGGKIYCKKCGMYLRMRKRKRKDGTISISWACACRQIGESAFRKMVETTLNFLPMDDDLKSIAWIVQNARKVTGSEHAELPHLQVRHYGDLIEKITIFDDGIVHIKLRYLSALWVFQIRK